jgi:hypothetical protein
MVIDAEMKLLNGRKERRRSWKSCQRYMATGL